MALRELTRAEVANRLGVSAGTIRHHVESSNRLYSLTAARIFDHLDTRVEHASDWQEYLVTIGSRFAELAQHHPGLDDYVLRGPYEASTLGQFERIMAELIGRDERITRPVAHLLGSRVLILSALMYSRPLERYPEGTEPPPEPYADAAIWTLRAFLRGADAFIGDNDVPALTPTPDAEWTHLQST